MIHRFDQQPGVRDRCKCGLYRSDPEHGESWTPTPANINALPESVRRYIHDLETNADPAGTIREAICQKENAMALARRVEELEGETTRKELDQRIAELEAEPDALLLQVAAFLTMITRGIFPAADQAKKEAAELLEKIGKRLGAHGG